MEDWAARYPTCVDDVAYTIHRVSTYIREIGHIVYVKPKCVARGDSTENLLHFLADVVSNISQSWRLHSYLRTLSLPFPDYVGRKHVFDLNTMSSYLCFFRSCTAAFAMTRPSMACCTTRPSRRLLVGPTTPSSGSHR